MNIEELIKENEELKNKLVRIENQKLESIDRKIWIGNRFTNLVIGIGLKKSLENLYSELPNKVKKETFANVTTHIIWRITRIGVFALLIGIIPGLVLVVQTYLIGQQTQVGRTQNIITNQQLDLLKQQVINEETTRNYTSLNNLYSSIENDLNNKESNNELNRLSDRIIGRISAVSQIFQPYVFFEGDSLIANPLSRERGQLLTYLISSNFDSITYKKINLSTTFAFADLKNAYLNGANLSGVSLNNSRLENSSTDFSDFENSELRGSDLSFSSSRMSFFDRASFQNSKIIFSNFSGSTFIDCDFRGADLRGSLFTGSNLRGSDFSNSDLREVDFRNSDLWNVNFNKARVDSTFMTDLKQYEVNGIDQIENLFAIQKSDEKFIVVEKD